MEGECANHWVSAANAYNENTVLKTAIANAYNEKTVKR